MTAKLSFFPVGNGAMTLLEFESGRRVLIDINIRKAADDPDDDTPDVAEWLKARLTRDDKGRRFVDAFLLSHPDQDHCRGLQTHFHFGPPDEWSKSADKILIRELWSSPMVFRRASNNHTLCEDAKAFNSEARRRVKLFRESGSPVIDGNRILILGEDQDGKTDDLTAILVKVDDTFSKINGQNDSSFVARLLAPHPKSEDEADEETSSKNHSSTVLNIRIAADGNTDACRFMASGDAEVAIWERLWKRHSGRKDWLSYDILEAPHHCSWHSLSYDSWSEKKEKAEVSQDARNALSQTRGNGSVIIASSLPIKDDDNDPPCIRAKREYEAILEPTKGTFKCVGEHPSEKDPQVLEYEIGKDGPRRSSTKFGAPAILGAGAVGRQPLPHG